MTTSTLDEAAKRKSLRRRHLVQRQTIIFGSLLVVLTALVLAGLGVFLNVLPPPFDPDFTDLSADESSAELVPCPADGALPVAFTSISANVYNGTTTGGLAATTAEALRSVGIATIAESNYPSGTLEGATLIVTGIDGVASAYTTAALFPDAIIRYDAARADATIDVVVGTTFAGMNGAALDPALPLVGAAGCTAITDLPRPTTA